MHVAAARFTPASLIAAATRAKAPGSFSISMTKSNGMTHSFGRHRAWSVDRDCSRADRSTPA
jgi:hypothetical protein